MKKLISAMQICIHVLDNSLVFAFVVKHLKKKCVLFVNSSWYNL